MNRRQVIGCIGTLATSLALAGCGPAKTDEVRYRIGVEFDTPDGVKSASSVIKVTRQHPPSYSPMPRWGWKIEGEAVFVDLGLGKHAIMLLVHGKGDDGGDSFLTLWGRAYGLNNGESFDAWNGKHSERIKGITELASELVPTIVTFTDITNPASAKIVRGEKVDIISPQVGGQQHVVRTPIDEMAATFGPGYAFRRATVEIVANDTPITRGIEGRLPWINDPELGKNPRWMQLPELARTVLTSLKRSGN
jgi:hypothetical protein